MFLSSLALACSPTAEDSAGASPGTLHLAASVAGMGWSATTADGNVSAVNIIQAPGSLELFGPGRSGTLVAAKNISGRVPAGATGDDFTLSFKMKKWTDIGGGRSWEFLHDAFVQICVPGATVKCYAVNLHRTDRTEAGDSIRHAANDQVVDPRYAPEVRAGFRHDFNLNANVEPPGATQGSCTGWPERHCQAAWADQLPTTHQVDLVVQGGNQLTVEIDGARVGTLSSAGGSFFPAGADSAWDLSFGIRYDLGGNTRYQPHLVISDVKINPTRAPSPVEVTQARAGQWELCSVNERAIYQDVRSPAPAAAPFAGADLAIMGGRGNGHMAVKKDVSSMASAAGAVRGHFRLSFDLEKWMHLAASSRQRRSVIPDSRTAYGPRADEWQRYNRWYVNAWEHMQRSLMQLCAPGGDCYSLSFLRQNRMAADELVRAGSSDMALGAMNYNPHTQLWGDQPITRRTVTLEVTGGNMRVTISGPNGVGVAMTAVTPEANARGMQLAGDDYTTCQSQDVKQWTLSFGTIWSMGNLERYRTFMNIRNIRFH